MSLSPNPLYRELASTLDARRRCEETENHEWFANHSRTLAVLADNFMPSSSGIDRGTKLDVDASTPEKLVFHFSYHHMDENGCYDGWTDHTLTVRPSLRYGIDLRISGPDRNGIKEYLYEVFQHALGCRVWQTPDCEWHSDLYGAKPPADVAS